MSSGVPRGSLLLLFAVLLGHAPIASATGAVHKFSPREAQPALDPSAPNSDHIAEAPAAATARGLLHVFLPGTGSAPSCCTDLLASSTAAGFHSLGVSYQWCSKPVAATAAWCDQHAPSDCGCQGRVHVAVCEGGAVPGLVDVSAASSIVARLEAALAYLHARWPEEGWSRYLVTAAAAGGREGGGARRNGGGGGGGGGVGSAIAWDKIVLSGHSQGAGHAAWLAKLRYRVAGVVPISGPEDTHPDCSWVAAGGGGAAGPSATPLSRFVPLAHSAEDSVEEIRANWAALGILGDGDARNGGEAAGNASSCAVDVGDAMGGAAAWGGACALLTSVKPAGIDVKELRPEHCSTAVDAFTPKVQHAEHAGQEGGAVARRTRRNVSDGGSGRGAAADVALYALEVWPWLLGAAAAAE
jgi:hypothetical protein